MDENDLIITKWTHSEGESENSGDARDGHGDGRVADGPGLELGLASTASSGVGGGGGGRSEEFPAGLVGDLVTDLEDGVNSEPLAQVVG